MDFFHGKTIVVTGAAGFIASHLCDKLLEYGASVIGIDNFLTGSARNIEHLQHSQNFTFIQANVASDPSTYLPSASIDAIFHLASPASPVTYQKYPVETYMVNSLGTHLLLQFLRKHNASARFLFASTSEIYGDPLEHPQQESYWGNVNPNGPRSMYDEAKRMGEAICGVHTRDFGMDVRIVRIFNTYGPRMDINDGRVIPDFFKNFIDKKPIVVHGDGKQTRSFCFVSDLVNGLLRLMERESARGETINIGNPGEMNMLELIDAMKTVTGLDPIVEFVQARIDDPHRRCPDISKAKHILDWEPKVTLEDGLQKTFEYFTKQQYANEKDK